MIVLPHLLDVAVLAIAGLVTLLAVLTVLRRASRVARERRRAALAEPLRPVLLRLAAGEDDEVAEASQVLAELDAERWSATERTVEGLLTKVRGETHAAVVALLERRGTLAAATARCGSRSMVARAHGAEVLGAAAQTSAVPQLLRLLQDREPEVRQVAARALGRIADPTSAQPLLRSLVGARPLPPRIVAGALMRIGSPGHDALGEVLDTGDPLQRAIAAEIAGLSGALRLATPLVALLTGDAEPEVRVRSAQALGRLGSPSALGPLLSATSDGCPPPLRVAATRALGDLGDPRSVDRLTELVRDPSHRVAGNAATALTRCGPAGLAALAALAVDPAAAHARDALATAALRGVVPPAPVPPVPVLPVPVRPVAAPPRPPLEGPDAAVLVSVEPADAWAVPHQRSPRHLAVPS